jgi:hypothetical protein
MNIISIFSKTRMKMEIINSDPVFFEIPEKLFFLGFHSLKNIFPKIKIDES